MLWLRCSGEQEVKVNVQNIMEMEDSDRIGINGTQRRKTNSKMKKEPNKHIFYSNNSYT